MKYFNNCNTVDEARLRLKELYREFHPDKYADPVEKANAEKVCQEFTEEYHAALKDMHETTSTGTDGKDHTYYYNEDKEQEVIDKLHEVLSAELPGCNIMLIGQWLWIDGETKPVKDTLKELSFKWHNKRVCWYWKPSGSRRRYNSNASLADLAHAYGYREFSGKQKEQEAALAA